MSFKHISQIPTQEDIVNLQKASFVLNTERNTSKRLRVVDRLQDYSINLKLAP